MSPTDDGLKRIIGSLNADYGLGIQCPDPLLSPSKRRALRRTEEERRVDAIYHKLHVLHFQRGKRLSACIGRFRTESRQLLEHSEASRPGATVTDVRFGISTADRAALQRCLLGILTETALPSRPKPAKRPSDEFSDPQAKRPRSRSGDPNLRQDDAVDSIPVRSSGKGQPEPPSPTAGYQGFGSTTMSYFTRTPSTVRSTSSTRTSFASRVFSSVDGGGPPSSYTTFSGSASQDQYPLCTQEHQALDESFSMHDTSAELGLATEITPPHIKAGSQPLEQRLKNIWPELPIHGFNEAPLAVIWEVTRVAQHCAVETSNWGLKYEPSESWHDQSKLRGMLANHGPFLGKGLPHASEPQAWALALDSFQSPDKAVILSADLAYRSDDTGPLFEFHLSPLKLELGHRLNRRFGADRFIEITMPSPTSSMDFPAAVKDDENHADKIIRWLIGKPHYFLGRSWVPYFIRKFKKTIQLNGQPKTLYQERVYLFAADGNSFRMPDTRGALPPPEEALTPSIRTKLKLSGFLEWAIRIQHNATQPITKLFSRTALSLTRTFPTVVLERHQIRHQAKDIGTHSVMNDGIGRMSRSLVRKISECLGLDQVPAGYQGRIGSAKGFWIVDVDDDGLDCDDWIETYPSQRKWDCDFQDAHHRTFEVKNWPRELRSAALNQQFIPVLEAQAVDRAAMRQAIAEHLANNLLADLDAQQKASQGHPADMRLWLQQTGQSRGGSVLHGHVPFLAGLPNSDEDAVAYLLDSGFDQQKLKYIQDFCWDLATKRAEQLKLKLHVKIPQSANMFMVADFSSTLDEGEVHVSFSSRFQVEGFCDTSLEGRYILVTRSPTHLPSDVQRVQVVSHPKLRQLKDVIVFSTKGKAPLADKLSGGDYDGDVAWVCWDRKIVDNFQNAAVPECLDLFEKGYLSKLELTFQGLNETNNLTFQGLRPHETKVDNMCANFVYAAFSFNMAQSQLGLCTKYKEKLCYNQNSVDSDEAVILSKLVGYLVDQFKQGIMFSRNDWNRLRNELIKDPYLEDPDYDNPGPSSRLKRKGEPHILDYLKFDVAGPVIDRALADFQQAVSGGQWFDGDLTQMFNHFNDKAERPKTSEMWGELLRQLRKDIEAVVATWRMRMKRVQAGQSDFVTEVKQVYQIWLNIMPSEKVRSLEPVQVLLEDWSKHPESSQWALLKASLTFKLYHKTKPKFAWRMAGRQLCLIKSKMTRVVGETAPATVHPEMYASLRPDKRFITARGAQRGLSREDESVAAVEEVLEFDDYGMAMDDL